MMATKNPPTAPTTIAAMGGREPASMIGDIDPVVDGDGMELEDGIGLEK